MSANGGLLEPGPSRRIGGLEIGQHVDESAEIPSRRIGGLEIFRHFRETDMSPSRRIGGLESR